MGLRVIDRIGKGSRTPPRDALLREVTPPEQRGRAYGFHRGADHFGAVLGSLAAWWLLRRGADVRSVIGWSAVPGVVAVAVLVVVLRVQGQGSRVQARPSPSGSRATDIDPRPSTLDPRRPSFWPALLALTGITFFRLPETLLILRLQDQGVAVAAVPLVWAGLHVVRSGSSYPGGWFSDRLGPRRLVAAGGLLFAAVAFVLGMGLGPTAAIALFLAFGLVA